MSVKKKYFLYKKEYSILDEIFSEMKIFFVSASLSGCSTKRMYEIQNKMRWENNNKKRVVEKLKKRGYLKIDKNGVFLTKLGREIYLKNKKIKDFREEKKKWDGIWRMISFDIPNEYTEVRDLLRRILLKAGFLQIQKSVYIYPHSLDEFIKFLNQHSDFKKFIIYSEILRSTGSSKWKEYFKDIIL